MGNLVGNFEEIPPAGQADFSPFPTPPERGWERENGAPGIPTKVGSGKSEVGNFQVRFTIPGEPQGKGRARVGSVAGRARMFTPAKTVAYEGLIAHAAQAAMDGRALIEGPCRVRVSCLFAIPMSFSKRKTAEALAGKLHPTKKPDADNVLKAVCDGMNGVVWRDDAQAVEVVVRKLYAPLPCVTVVVEEVTA